MGIIQEKLREFIYGPDLDALNLRAFNPGTVAVDHSTHTFGIDPEQWSPAEYGTYIASSTGVYTVIKKRSTYLASLPLTLARLKADGSADRVTTGALYELTRKVNPYWTWRRLIEMTEMSLCLWGSAFWMLERSNGVPSELYWARPDRVKVIPHATNYVARFEYAPVSGMEPIRFLPDEVIWFRYPNPLDEYSGLSPLAAARLAADTQSAAMKQNRNLFANGISIGGLVTPGGNVPMGQDAAREIKEQLTHRAKGTANAHRWLVLMHDAKFQPMSMSPRDAEFIGLHKLTLEDIARPYGVPLDLIGGQRTYANYEEAVKSMWADTIIPEAAFLADEITEQLLPMFSGSDRADVCHFDHSAVKALQDDEEMAWRIAEGQLRSGVKTINEWRAEHDLDDVAWGEAVWWGSVALIPIKDAEEREPLALEEGEEPDDGPGGDDESGEGGRQALSDAVRQSGSPMLERRETRITYGSDEHQRIWDRFVARTEAHEATVARTSRKLFRAQEQSVLTELGKFERAALPDDLDITELMGKLFSIQKWRRRFREAMRPTLGTIIADAGQTAVDEVAVGVAFDVTDPLVARFLHDRAQRFAVEVNDTTWRALKKSLAEGLEAGEGTDVLAKRVRAVMGDRIRSSDETIARTETISAYSGGTIEGYRQSGVVDGVEWLAALDERTRETHVAAHGQVVALGENFTVGGSRGAGPGLIEKAGESINCRCTTLAVLMPLA